MLQGLTLSCFDDGPVAQLRHLRRPLSSLLDLLGPIRQVRTEHLALLAHIPSLSRLTSILFLNDIDTLLLLQKQTHFTRVLSRPRPWAVRRVRRLRYGSHGPLAEELLLLVQQLIPQSDDGLFGALASLIIK